MWRCVGESCAHCLTANGKGMELGVTGSEVAYPRIGVFTSSSHPLILILSFLDPITLSLWWSHVFSRLSQRDSQTLEDWMKWETESNGVQGSKGMSWEQSETLNGRKKTATMCLYTMFYYLIQRWLCCMSLCVSLPMFGISVKVGNRSAKEIWVQLPPLLSLTEHLLQRG